MAPGVGLRTGAAPAIPAESPLPGTLALPARPDAARERADAVSGAVRNVFSVDLEDWYQGLEIDMEQWGSYPGRIETGLEVLLELLDQAGVRATFFVLG